MNRLLITFLCFAVVIGVGMFLVMPEYQEYRGLAVNINDQKADLQYYRDYSAELRKIEAKLESYQETISKIEDFLPTEFSIPLFYANIQNMSSQSGMILTNIQEDGIQEKEEIKERFYNLTVVGDFSSFKNFLSDLEKSAKLIEVEHFSLSADMVEEERLKPILIRH